ncbi:MAG: phosphoenolpyruvate synthase/pyruvate phosphate dikinase [Oligoflexales bacterium]|nr:phosphoenolpyruvate synthase/pyruvate phosphate dikinase [Oligoflexales bacterium]
MDATVKTYHRLMPNRVAKILIVSSPYDAFVMQEDGGMMEQVFTSYRGLSLASIPRFTVVSTAKKALYSLAIESFDLVIIIVPKLLGMDAIQLGREIKKQSPDLPVILLAHSMRSLDEYKDRIQDGCIDKVFLWSGNRDILWAILTWAEDRMNVTHDTAIARVRVILLIEDSPYYYSSMLPILYKAVLHQTQDVLMDTLNEEHRLWKLRARTKILLAQNFEEGMDLYKRYRPYLIGVLADTKFPRNGEVDPEAGIIFLKTVMADLPDLPRLLLSSEKSNQEAAQRINTLFQDKNSPSLHLEIRKFLLENLGFGDFVFRLPDGTKVASASNLQSMENALREVPEESLRYHLAFNHFPNWFMARSEIFLAAKFRATRLSNFSEIEDIREYLVNSLYEKRMLEQRGVIALFRPEQYSFDYEFLKIGQGSLGGKARGLAFMAKHLQENMDLIKKFQNIRIHIPRSLIITTDCFDTFLEENYLQDYSEVVCTDEETARRFALAHLPDFLMKDLKAFLRKVKVPLAVRSSSLLEDSLEQPYAGLYATYMLPNNREDIQERLNELALAVKLVYASVFYEGPKAFSRSTHHRTEEEKMAVLIQPILGSQYGDCFYPTLSGTAQSYNFYPIAQMASEEGIAHISLGLGKIVVEGGQTLRFCPQHPQSLYQFSTVDDVLRNSQQYFYALDLSQTRHKTLILNQSATLAKRDVYDSSSEFPVKYLSSSYFLQDHVIRDQLPGLSGGVAVLTFANVLKYERIPLAGLISQLLKIGRLGFGCEIELEFAVNVPERMESQSEFVLLQARPMTTPYESRGVEITEQDIDNAVVYSKSTLGFGSSFEIRDIIYVKPGKVSSRTSAQIVREISKVNSILQNENRKYLLIGPGRWGSADHCLGIPVAWQDISEVAGIVETKDDNFRADPSQGTHFFQNITSLRVIYFTVHQGNDFVKWDWLTAQNLVSETEFIRHVRTQVPLSVKINGKRNHGVIMSL